MIARIQKSIKDRDQGFTLIELLVVMIIIGILAAIAVPVFLNQRKKAVDTSARSDVSNIGKELATYYVDNAGNTPAVSGTSGRYVIGSGATAIDVGRVSIKSENTPVASATGAGADTWCTQITYKGGSKGDAGVVSYSAKNGLQDATCAVATA